MRLRGWKWKDVRRHLHRPLGPVDQTDGRRDRTVQHGIGVGHPIPMPRLQDPQPMDSAQPRLNGRHCGEPAGGRPLAGDRHGGFGERPEETDQEQSRHRAPGRLDHWLASVRRNLCQDADPQARNNNPAAPETARHKPLRAFPHECVGVAGPTPHSSARAPIQKDRKSHTPLCIAGQVPRLG
jgi:hypothetical protein